MIPSFVPSSINIWFQLFHFHECALLLYIFYLNNLFNIWKLWNFKVFQKLISSIEFIIFDIFLESVFWLSQNVTSLLVIFIGYLLILYMFYRNKGYIMWSFWCNNHLCFILLLFSDYVFLHALKVRFEANPFV